MRTTTDQTVKPIKGQTVTLANGRSGIVKRYQGPLAVQVLTPYTATDQEFTTGRLITTTGLRLETWPLRLLQAV